MGDGTRAPTQIISLPQGGGAMHGLGEKFSPDLHTGTGNFTVPITVPQGRRGHEPKLDLVYSTGNGSGYFGLGWTLTVPGVARKTSHGVPRYQGEQDTFILSGAEDLVPVDRPGPHQARYRPRTEGLFARIVHHHDPGAGIDHWEVATKDGLVSRYGSAPPDNAPETWRDPATIAHPDVPGQVFAWKLTETRDPFGNLILYDYDTDEGHGQGHRWRQPLLRRIRYADYIADGETRFFASVTFDYEQREDAFSDYRAGFEIRTTRRCCAITTRTHADKDRLVRHYELTYNNDSFNGMSLLRSVQLVGFDDAGDPHRDLPPLQFGYSQFSPEDRSFQPVRGADPPPASLARGDYELVDLTGDALPDVLELNGTARYWRNLGGGTFDRPRTMRSAPSGLRLADRGVQLLDADGDGHADLLVTTPAVAGYFPLRFDAGWGNFQPYTSAPTFNLEDPQVRLVDLTGDGVTDVLRVGTRVECWFHDPDTGWSGPRPARSDGPDGLPSLSFTDPRVKLADMTGDGLQDIVLVYSGNIAYWPNLGHGRFGSRIRMVNSPRLPDGYDPARILLGDIGGDGLADLVYVDNDSATVWFNRTGNGWSDPITVKGTPAPGITDSLRVVDFLGTGTGGILYSRDMPGPGRPSMFFLDLTGGAKPRLLAKMDNNIGAITEVDYAPSTRFALADAATPATRWRTRLPIVVPVVARVTVYDQVSRGKLVTQYCYHHGYWDGLEREFRGFGRVDQVDTQTFDDYHTTPGPSTFSPVDLSAFSPPTLTKTWFHLGPVGEEDGGWAELDWSSEYWSGDPNQLQHTERVNAFLRGLLGPAGGSDRRARRDALRALRGTLLRSELYGLDRPTHQDRPYTITEQAYDLREEPSETEPGRHRIIFPLSIAQRTTQWERGDDPMTRFNFTGDYDQFGQPRQLTSVAMPRRSARRRAFTGAVVGAIEPDETRVLATHTRTVYAAPAAGVYIHDRVAQSRTYELSAPPGVQERAPNDVREVLADQVQAAAAIATRFDLLDAADVRLVKHQVHHYDGAAFTGLDCGEVDQHGLLTRTATLVFTGETLANGYETWRPAYLGGNAPLPAGAPAGFGEDLGYHLDPPGPGYAHGWYAETTCQAHDVQLAARESRGLTLQIRDALLHETVVTPDDYWLFPAKVQDPVGLTGTANYNYRVGQPQSVIDPNGTTTHWQYHPLGLLMATFVEGAAGEGGTEDQPDIYYSYQLHEFATRGQPICVRKVSRVWHASNGVSDETIESREYSDGFGRLVQSRAHADELAFGDDRGLLVTEPNGRPQAVPGQVRGPATGGYDPERVVVSGWQVYDNKGRVVEKYEPFFDSGWEYQPEEQARHGRRVVMFYDPRGQLIQTVNPDGSQRRVLFGVPRDRSDPDSVVPTPWVTTVYDENDLAAHGTAPGGDSLADRAPASHHHTPTFTVIDAMGRTVCQLVQGGAYPAADSHVTRTGYDVRGNVLIVIDEHGRTAFANTYDLTDAPLRTVSIDAGTKIAVRDAAGNLVHSGDERECVTLRTYDQLNRLTAVYARDQPGVDLSLREQLIYGDQAADQGEALANHRLGRLWRHLDEAGLIVAETYDFAGRLTEQIRQVVSDAAIASAEPAGWTANWATPGVVSVLDPAEHRTSTRYDALGRPVEILAPAGVTGRRRRVVPTYGRSGALQSVAVDEVPYIRFLSRNARGQRLLLTYGNGLMTRYAYDPDTFRLTRLRTETAAVDGDVWTGSGPVLQDLTYRYDLVGNVTSIEERTIGCGVRGTAAGRDRLVRIFGYDAFYRLTSATGRACDDTGSPRPPEGVPRCGSYPAAPTQANAPDVTTGYRECYEYDPAGNLANLLYQVTTGSAPHPRWHRRFGIGGLAAGESTEAPNDRLTSVTNGSSATRTIGYDKVGNMISEGGSRSYNWDHAGRLVGFREGSVVARYLYDADGLRVRKWVRRNGAPALDESTIYLGNLVEHHRWAGGTSELLHVFDGANRIALVRSGPPRPRDASPEVMYQLTDHLGSSSLTVNMDRTWITREEYFPYGETSFGGFSRKRYRFTGRERDEENSFSHHSTRYYAPWLARFTTPDSIGPIDGCSLYAYARDNPLRYVDPNGTIGVEVTGVAAGTSASTSGAGLGSTSGFAGTTTLGTSASTSGAGLGSQAATGTYSAGLLSEGLVVAPAPAIAGMALGFGGIAFALLSVPALLGLIITGASEKNADLTARFGTSREEQPPMYDPKVDEAPPITEPERQGIGAMAPPGYVPEQKNAPSHHTDSHTVKAPGQGGPTTSTGPGTPSASTWFAAKHHIVTNKSQIWSPEFRDLFKQAGVTTNKKDILNYEKNLMEISPHGPAHGDLYHALIAIFLNGLLDAGTKIDKALEITANEIRKHPEVLDPNWWKK